MAKKKPVGRIVIAGFGIGVLIATIIPVMIFVFGIGLDDILPQEVEAEPQPLQVPTLILCIEGFKQVGNECVQDIITIIENPELFCTIPQSELEKIAECELLTRDEQFVSIDPNAPVDACSQVNLQSALSCEKQIDELILQLIMEQEPIIDPIPPNGTETSIDDPFTQLCDQDPTLIICGDSRSLELLTRVLKTDSAGVQTIVETTTIIPQFAIFGEDETNIDFRTGQLQFEVFIKGDPNLRYSGTGKVDLLVGDQSLFLQPIDVKVDGIADENGMVDLLFVSPTGGTSDLILFDFEENFDKFPNESITPVRLQVVELNIAGEREQNFAMVDQDIFTMDIVREDIKILITDEQGIVSRIYPSDSKIIITARTSKTDPVPVGTIRQTIFDSPFRGNGLGCGQFTVITDRTFTPTTTQTAIVPAPSISGITILDSKNSIVTTGSGTFSYDQLTRNQNYTINISEGNLQSTSLDYGKSQETKSYACTQEGTAVTTTSIGQYGSTLPCGTYTQITSITVTGVTVTPNSISCNFPQESP